MSVVVVGGSLAGLRAAETLISRGSTEDVIVVSAERHPPYNRPPLSKTALLPDPGRPPVPLRSRYDGDPRLRWLSGRTAVSADLTARSIRLDTGDVLAYSGLVAATGLRSRRLDLPGPAAGRHAVRTVDDALGLRHDLTRARAVVIVGAGVLGCELAMTLCGLGHVVTVIDPFAPPLARVLGNVVSADLQARMTRNGIRFVIGVEPRAVLGEDTAAGMGLADGTEIEATVVVEAVGSRPNVEWLGGNGLDLSDGVLCANTLAVCGWHDVVACGDVARFPRPGDPGTSSSRRTEHWTLAVETARRAGATLAARFGGEPAPTTPFDPTPYFWSVLGDVDVHCLGRPAEADRTEVFDGVSGSDVTYVHLANDTVVGVTSVGRHRAQQHASLLGSLLPA